MENLWRYYISTDVFDTGGVVYASDESMAISKILRYYNDERLATQDVFAWIATEDDDYDNECPDVLMVY